MTKAEKELLGRMKELKSTIDLKYYSYVNSLHNYDISTFIDGIGL